MAYQALALIGAGVASAAITTCSFSGGTLTLAFTTDLVFSQDAAGNILVGGAKTDTIAVGCTTSAAANLVNTTAVNVQGDALDNVLTFVWTTVPTWWTGRTSTGPSTSVVSKVSDPLRLNLTTFGADRSSICPDGFDKSDTCDRWPIWRAPPSEEEP